MWWRSSFYAANAWGGLSLAGAAAAFELQILSRETRGRPHRRTFTPWQDCFSRQRRLLGLSRDIFQSVWYSPWRLHIEQARQCCSTLACSRRRIRDDDLPTGLATR